MDVESRKKRGLQSMAIKGIVSRLAFPVTNTSPTTRLSASVPGARPLLLLLLACAVFPRPVNPCFCAASVSDTGLGSGQADRETGASSSSFVNETEKQLLKHIPEPEVTVNRDP